MQGRSQMLWYVVVLVCAARGASGLAPPVCCAGQAALHAGVRPPLRWASRRPLGNSLRAAPRVGRSLTRSSAASRAPEDEGDGKKNENPLLLRILLAAASNSAAVLARALRPFSRAGILLREVLRDPAKHRALRFLAGTLALMMFASLSSSLGAGAASSPAELPYSEVLKMVSEGRPLQALTVSLKRLDFVMDGRPHFARIVLTAPALVDLLTRKGYEFRAPAPSRADSLGPLLLPVVWLAGFVFFYARQSRQMTSNVGKRASAQNIGEPLTFDDVQGVAKAKGEVQEVVQMLKEPDRYLAAGVRLPSGILLAGPPGTGKTLLARVLAAEAGVPFFFCSGSDFVEIFVGRGASRLRSLFLKAAKVAPCVIFIDELDALGKRRSLRLTGSNDEVEQTLNQLLACMDGLDSNNNGVIVVGATNRPSLLDPALIRPGRFDRVVQLDLPDAEGRVDILAVHVRKLKLAGDVDLVKIAEMTAGMSGAELAAIANEAAIRMVRRGGQAVSQVDFVTAVKDYTKSRTLQGSSLIDKLILGST